MRKLAKKSHKNIPHHVHNVHHVPTKELIKRWSCVFLCTVFAFALLQQREIILSPDASAGQNAQIHFVFDGTAQSRGMQEPENVHGAGSDWDFLFSETANTTTQQTGQYQGEMVVDKDLGVISSGDIKDYLGKDTGTTNTNTNTTTVNNSLGASVEVVKAPTSQTGVPSVNLGTIEANKTIAIEIPKNTTGTVAAGDVVVHKIKNNCTAPWGETVTHGTFVLAYEQRKDTPDICAIQKRLCVDGALKGSYTQSSCIQGTYEYIKKQVIAQNQTVQQITQTNTVMQTTPEDTAQKSEFIQPNAPRFSGAAFDSKGKIQIESDPIDTRQTGKNTGSRKVQVYTTQKDTSRASCVTPRGTSVTNGQFVKAYKSSLGLLDMPCEVEIRLCVMGDLKGSFKNKSCNIKNMTYRDYLVGNKDENKPTVSDLVDLTDSQSSIDKSNSSSFWTRLRNKLQ